MAQTEALPSDTLAALPLVAIERQGYAFDSPRVLAQQRLFGIWHGVNLLSKACEAVPQHAAAVAASYQQWQTLQHDALADIHGELARYYFGLRADEATSAHIVRALNLRESLNLAPDSAALAAACETLPQALSMPRYDLAHVFALDEALARASLLVRSETLVEKCSSSQVEPPLSDEARAALQSQFLVWKDKQEPSPEQIRQQVLTLWQALGREGDATQWFVTSAQRYAKPLAQTCQQLPVWLASEAANVSAVFRSPPLPVNPEQRLTVEAAEQPVVAVAIPVRHGATEERVALTVSPAIPTEPAPPVQADKVVDETPPPLPTDVLMSLQSLFDLLMKVLSHDPADAPH